jgi:hypothetical protein
MAPNPVVIIFCGVAFATPTEYDEFLAVISLAREKTAVRMKLERLSPTDLAISASQAHSASLQRIVFGGGLFFFSSITRPLFFVCLRYIPSHKSFDTSTTSSLELLGGSP